MILAISMVSGLIVNRENGWLNLASPLLRGVHCDASVCVSATLRMSVDLCEQNIPKA